MSGKNNHSIIITTLAEIRLLALVIKNGLGDDERVLGGGEDLDFSHLISSGGRKLSMGS